MTKKEAMEILNETQVVYFAPNGKKKVQEALDMAIEALQHDEIFEQIKWERDVALQTLEEHDIGLGQKAEPSNTPTESTNTPTDAPIEALKADVARWSSWNKTFEQSGITDIISRTDAVKAICSAQCELDVPHYPQCDQAKYCDEIQALLALPSADAEESYLNAFYDGFNTATLALSADRPQGEWIVEHSGNGWNEWLNLTCSICGKKHECIPYTYNYCSNCGARMKGGDDEW